MYSYRRALGALILFLLPGAASVAQARAESDPAVAAILARFPGAKIIDVRIPDAPEAETAEAEVPVEPSDRCFHDSGWAAIPAVRAVRADRDGIEVRCAVHGRSPRSGP